MSDATTCPLSETRRSRSDSAASVNTRFGDDRYQGPTVRPLGVVSTRDERGRVRSSTRSDCSQRDTTCLLTRRIPSKRPHRLVNRYIYSSRPAIFVKIELLCNSQEDTSTDSHSSGAYSDHSRRAECPANELTYRTLSLNPIERCIR